MFRNVPQGDKGIYGGFWSGVLDNRNSFGHSNRLPVQEPILEIFADSTGLLFCMVPDTLVVSCQK